MGLYTLDTPGSAEAIEAAGDRVVLADGEGGLVVYRQAPAQVYLPLVACS
jgi:hypothetical protein